MMDMDAETGNEYEVNCQDNSNNITRVHHHTPPTPFDVECMIEMLIKVITCGMMCYSISEHSPSTISLFGVFGQSRRHK